jgi:SAM-dependent methyltransferase
MRLRLRDQSEANYQIARSNDNAWEHQVRTLACAGLIAFLKPRTVLDLACGDGSLVFTANHLEPIGMATFVDISKPSIEKVTKRAYAVRLPAIARVMDADEFLDAAITAGEHWDLALVCEFLEHIPDPAALLRKVHRVSQLVLASSPLIEGERGDPNPEHVWAFDREGYLEMLGEAGWKPKIYESLMLREGYYNFQIWVCEHG